MTETTHRADADPCATPRSTPRLRGTTPAGGRAARAPNNPGGAARLGPAPIPPAPAPARPRPPPPPALTPPPGAATGARATPASASATAGVGSDAAQPAR